ncbi:G2/M phase-specific E3 ubiquitin-protein ligase-like [Tubulanus polymorphus]|uniref:G2/M phase-specific E3 ubiquitin-protein ligase-like n=1 Tax=Tubulanus polymorphus TaxID=672921 RepID=UPI003DA513C3
MKYFHFRDGRSLEVIVKDHAAKLNEICDEAELVKFVDENIECRFEMGFTKPSIFIKLSDKQKIVEYLALNFLVHRSKSELNQLLEGMSTLGVLDLIRKFPSSFEKVFSGAPSPMSVDYMTQLFHVDYSPPGSNKRVEEEQIIMNWTFLLEESFEGNIKEKTDVGEMTLSLEDIHMFVTGSSQKPIIGFHHKPRIEFNHSGDGYLVHANTCAMVIRLPVNKKMLEVKSFVKEMTFCIYNSPGFGCI